MRHALLAGATGLVGSALLRRLIASEQYSRVHVVGRRELPFNDPKVMQHVIEFDLLEELELDAEIDDVFCTLGTTIKKAGSQQAFRRVDHDYVLSLARLAKRLGAQRFAVVSSMGADPMSRNFYFRVKGQMEEGLRSVGLPRLYIIRPALLTGEREEYRRGEELTQKLLTPLATFFVGPLRKYRPVSAGQVAEALHGVVLGEQEAFRVFESDAIQAVSAGSRE